MSEAPDQEYAFFDLDHTLLPYDTQVLFCNYVLRRHFLRRFLLLPAFAIAPLYALGVFSTRTFKTVFHLYLWRMPVGKLKALAEEFVQKEAKPVLYPEVLAEVKRHQEEGRTLILNSASPDIYLHALGREMGFEHIFGTQFILGEDSEPFFPQIEGANNKKAAKIPPMESLIPGITSAENLPGCWAYSDSVSDVPLLALAEHKVLIHPDEKLAALGEEGNWTVLYPKRPYAGERGAKLASLFMALGLFSR